VLEREPDFSLLPRNIRPRIAETLERCLEKNPKKRWHHAADVRLGIQEILEDENGKSAKEDLVSHSQRRSHRTIPLIAAAAGLSMLVAGYAVWNLGPVFRYEVQPTIQFVYELPENTLLIPIERWLMYPLTARKWSMLPTDNFI
jgi:hypothetical protein